MRTYVVQPGDTPASIAAQDSMAGCPKCSRDILAVNPHKPTITHPNGYKTFRELRAGEVLNLPDKWFNGDLDSRPPAYFAALPYADGRTPSSLGDAAAGILGDYATLDEATILVGTLPAMDDSSFSAAVPDTAALIDSSVQEVGSSSPGASQAQYARGSTSLARQRNTDLANAISTGNQTAATQTRLNIQNNFSAAIGQARLALQSYYGSQPTPTIPSTPTIPPLITAAAQAAAAAIGANPNYCAAVAQSGSAVNLAVHAFKTAWNAANPSNPVPIGTGNYEQATAAVLSQILGGSAPPACPPSVAPVPSVPSIPIPSIVPPPQPQPTASQGLSTGAVLGMTVLGAGAVGGAIYFSTHPKFRKHIRRIRRRS